MKIFVLLACCAAAANALVCPPDACKGATCTLLDEQACLAKGGAVRPGGMCGCCDVCITLLKEGDKCIQLLLLGVPATAECGEGLKCSPESQTCVKKNCLERKADFEGNLLTRVGAPKLNCEDNGDYSPKQCLGSKCMCVTKKGDRISNYMVNIWEALDMGCECARAEYEYSQKGGNDKPFNCDSKGNYFG
ncbi:uncharacterized protein LOC106170252 isoform X2 [Lingula anatina]|uniref:Uncharacterized protein LOC106170252 isoform X2 n=1 Tax=Lingula anatina TaxID=7574 RepID=A0A1S3J6N0_LINAN|nr:uncharacterized protein LOC106170252 isoform X2 [Lingula anatina]|eukprot:XP_013405499.1 uncharacterized protein LOC106170252 isoform X2 [Lingula anatina]